MKARSAARRSTAFALAVCSMCSFATGASAQQDETGGTETETETAPPKPHRRTASETETPPASESAPPPAAAKGVARGNRAREHQRLAAQHRRTPQRVRRLRLRKSQHVHGAGDGQQHHPGHRNRHHRGQPDRRERELSHAPHPERVRAQHPGFQLQEERDGVDRPFRSRRALVGHPVERLGLHQRADVRARGLPQARRPLGQLHGRPPACPLQPRGHRDRLQLRPQLRGGMAVQLQRCSSGVRPDRLRRAVPLLPRRPRVRDAFAGRLSVHGRRVRPDDPGRKVGAFDHARRSRPRPPSRRTSAWACSSCS